MAMFKIESGFGRSGCKMNEDNELPFFDYRRTVYDEISI